MVPPRHNTHKCYKQIRFGWKVRAADPVRRLTAGVKQLIAACRTASDNMARKTFLLCSAMFTLGGGRPLGLSTTLFLWSVDRPIYFAGAA